MSKARLLFGSTFLALAVLLSSGAMAQPAAHVLPKVAKVTVNSPVTLTDNGDSWTLDNGIVKATILKRDGNLTSLVYHGVDILTHGKYWEQTPAGTITARVTIDPATNGGERAEVSVKGVNPVAALAVVELLVRALPTQALPVPVALPAESFPVAGRSRRRHGH